MTWISINPSSESKPAVQAAAYIIGIDPETISSVELAHAYNQIADYHTPPLAPQAGGNINDFINSVSALLNEEIEED